MTTIAFGTDGWRGIIADEFTFANVERMAQAAADHWRRHPPPDTRLEVVVGHDSRFLSAAFASRVAEVFAGNGVRVVLSSKPTPTPALSWAVKARGAAGGIMITASHNPPEYNGFKVKAWYGGSAGTELCRAIEGCLDGHRVRRLAVAEARRAGLLEIRDLRPAHWRAVRRLVDLERISKARLRVAHDAMHGVGAGCFTALLSGTRCRVTPLHAELDPMFGGIRPEPVPANYAATQRYLRGHEHDVCLVTDGDADRLGCLDGRGRPLTAHEVLALLLRHLVEHRGLRGRVVKALTTTSMIDSLCAAYGLPLTETPVGFRHLATEMARGDVLVGLEESGSFGLPSHLPERDGLAGGMMLLELLAWERKPLGALLDELERKLGRHRYARRDLRFPIERRSALMESCAAHPPVRLGRSPVVEVKTFDGVKYIAADGSWLMVRGSGTEPVVRVYAEAGSEGAVGQLVACGVRLVRRGLSA